MKPSIVNIIYFVLGLILFGSVPGILDVFMKNSESIFVALYNSSILIIYSVASIVAIIGLRKRASWSRWVSFAVTGTQSIIIVAGGVYFYFVDFEKGMVFVLIAVIYGIPASFLTYKIFASIPLKEYLSNA